MGMIGLLAVSLSWFFLSGVNDPSSSDPSASSSSSEANRPFTLAERVAQRRQAREAAAKEYSAALQAIYARWDETKRELTGPALVDARKEIARDAVMQLGGGDALFKFLEFLKNEGQGDLIEWVTGEGMKELFASERAEEARAWLLGIEDLKLQESMCFAAGQGFKGPGFKEYLDSFGSIHSQSRLLGGYFSEMAKSDPEAAVKGFLAAKPPKVDFTALRHVMAAVPPGSDFVALSGMVPADGPTLATNARKALLGAWAASAPQEAADYILSNTRLVKAEQLGPVIEAWLEQDAAGAREWVEGLGEGEHRKIGMEVLGEVPGDQ